MRRDILIVSDTHGMSSRLSELVSYRQSLLRDGEVLGLIYLGDGLRDLFSLRQYGDIITYAVRGNCDIYDRLSPSGEEIPLHGVVNIGDYRVFYAHGHTLSVKYGRDELLREASRLGADIALFGHTHAPALEYIKKGSARGIDRDIALFNPGSLSSYDGDFGNLSIGDGGFLLSHGKYINLKK